MMRGCPDAPRAARSFQPSRINALEKNGPTVCDGVCLSLMSPLHRRGVAAAQHEVEAVAQRILRHRHVDVEGRDEPLARVHVGNAVEDWVQCEQRITGEIHLRDEACSETRTKETEMDMLWPPRVVVIAPRIRAWLHRHETIHAALVGHDAPDAAEMRINRRIMLIDVMRVAAGGIRLPDLNERPTDRSGVFVKHPSGDDDPLAQRFAAVPATEVCISSAHGCAVETRSRDLRDRLLKPNRRLLGRALQRARVRGIRIGWVRTGILARVAAEGRHRFLSALILWC